MNINVNEWHEIKYIHLMHEQNDKLMEGIACTYTSSVSQLNYIEGVLHNSSLSNWRNQSNGNEQQKRPVKTHANVYHQLANCNRRLLGHNYRRDLICGLIDGGMETMNNGSNCVSFTSPKWRSYIDRSSTWPNSISGGSYKRHLVHKQTFLYNDWERGVLTVTYTYLYILILFIFN